MAECWKAICNINYHHQYYADVCSAIMTCTSFSDNILPGLKGQPHCVATKRVFNIAKTHGFSIVSCDEKFCQLTILGAENPYYHRIFPESMVQWKVGVTIHHEI